MCRVMWRSEVIVVGGGWGGVGTGSGASGGGGSGALGGGGRGLSCRGGGTRAGAAACSFWIDCQWMCWARHVGFSSRLAGIHPMRVGLSGGGVSRAHPCGREISSDGGATWASTNCRVSPTL